jgi:hypothetical protein
MPVNRSFLRGGELWLAGALLAEPDDSRATKS